ncbi:MAG: FecR family protein [Verrucomicrobiota bacterium]
MIAQSDNFRHYQLAEDYFVRDLNEEELTELQQALQSNPDLRAALAEHARNEWLLNHLHSGQIPDNVIVFPAAERPRWPLQVARVAAILLLLLSAAGAYYFTTEGSRFNPISLHLPKTRAVVEEIYTLPGDVIMVSNGTEEWELSAYSLLKDGETVYLPPGARLTYKYRSDDTLVHVNSDTTLTLLNEGGAKHIQLDKGGLKAEVDRQPEGKPLRVFTADAEAVVLGTSFEIFADETTQLAVLTGRVGFQSHDAKNQVEVGAGFFVESNSDGNWQSRPFRMLEFQPVADQSINETQKTRYIAVDPEREYSGFLKFNLDELRGDIVDARMRLRVEKFGKDHGGSGTIRLFSVPANTDIHSASSAMLTEVASYTGKVSAGMNLEFQVDTSDILPGINTFLIKLDRGGNDFWFSSSRGKNPPELRLKVEQPDTL